MYGGDVYKGTIESPDCKWESYLKGGWANEAALSADMVCESWMPGWLEFLTVQTTFVRKTTYTTITTEYDAEGNKKITKSVRVTYEDIVVNSTATLIGAGLGTYGEQVGDDPGFLFFVVVVSFLSLTDHIMHLRGHSYLK